MLEIAVRGTALLLLDFENYSVHPDGYWAQQDPAAAVRGGRAMANARRALTAAREVGMTVVHIGQQWREGYPELNRRSPWEASALAAGRSIAGTWATAFCDEVAPIAGELVIPKRTMSAFIATELDRLLRVRGINTIVLAGVVTNFAVEAAARDGADLGYGVIVLADCCETINDEMQRFALEVIFPLIALVSDANEFAAALKSA
ncbi:MAG: cysteine hydrolase [Chloroflexota bacterium]|nr:cysteine hydrolase [Chloroflexota bacterium]